MFEAVVLLFVCLYECVCVCVMAVSSLKASPTQASDNKQINVLSLLPLRIKVEDGEHNEEEE